MPVVAMIPVRCANESKRTPPKMFLTREACMDLYNAGLAEWNKKGTALTLKRRDADMYRTAPSLKPNERTMDGYVEGKAHAVAIINSYAYRFAA